MTFEMQEERAQSVMGPLGMLSAKTLGRQVWELARWEVGDVIECTMIYVDVGK